MSEPSAAVATIDVEFLGRVWATGWHSLNWKMGSSFHSQFFPDFEALAEKAAQLDGREVWWGVHGIADPPSRGRGRSEHVTAVRTLAADLDWHHPVAHADENLPDERTMRAAVAEFPWPPTFQVNTGHGLQAYWLLDRELDPVEGLRLSERLHVALAAAGLKPERRDLASVLRLPGTRNHKDPDDPKPVVVERDDGPTWNPDELSVVLPEPQTTPPVSQGTGPAPDSRERNGEATPDVWDALRERPRDAPGPMDRVAARLDLPTELARRGWVHVHDHPRGAFWRRPGKDRDHSADVNNNGRLYVYSTNTPLPCSDENGKRTYDALDVVAHYEHGGDRQAAARALAPELGIEWAAETRQAGWNDVGGDSFLPIPLGPVLAGEVRPPEPTILRRDDGQCLLYPGQINGIHADSGTGKGWVALLAAAQQMQGGRTVMLIDLEDVPSSIVERLRLLGVADHHIEQRLLYIRPTDPFGAAAVAGLVQLIEQHRVSLVIVDSIGEAFGLNGIDENHDSEVGPWLRHVPRPMADAGAAVLLIDHSTKANDNPLHPSGSKRKRAAIGGASYYVTASTPLSKDTGGRLKLTCAKDRHGWYARGEHVANLVMKTGPAGVGVELYAESGDQDQPPPKVEILAREIARIVAEAEHPLSKTAARALIQTPSRKDDKYEAVEVAIARGWVVQSRGSGNRWDLTPGEPEETP